MVNNASQWFRPNHKDGVVMDTTVPLIVSIVSGCITLTTLGLAYLIRRERLKLEAAANARKDAGNNVIRLGQIELDEYPTHYVAKIRLPRRVQLPDKSWATLNINEPPRFDHDLQYDVNVNGTEYTAFFDYLANRWVKVVPKERV